MDSTLIRQTDWNEGLPASAASKSDLLRGTGKEGEGAASSRADAAGGTVVPDANMRVFTLTGAMMDTVVIMMESLSDTTNLITNTMALSNNLIGPMMSQWNTYYQGVLKFDQAAIPLSGDGIAKAQAQFNEDNTVSSSANTGLGALSSMISQQISTGTQNYSNKASTSQQLAMVLAQGISQNWVV